MPAEEPDLSADDDFASLEREREEQVRLLAQLATRRRVLRRIAASAPPPAPKSEESIARDMGLSRRQVRRILNRVLGHIKHRHPELEQYLDPQP